MSNSLTHICQNLEESGTEQIRTLVRLSGIKIVNNKDISQANKDELCSLISKDGSETNRTNRNYICPNFADPTDALGGNDSNWSEYVSDTGICWDTPQSFVEYISYRDGQNSYDNNTLDGLRTQLYDKTFNGQLYNQRDIENLLSSNIDSDLKRRLQLAVAPAADPRTLPEETMELILRTGQILQNAGPAWEEVLEGSLPRNLRKQWDLIKNTTTVLEPPIGLLENEELSSAISTVKAESFNIFYFHYRRLAPEFKKALFSLKSEFNSALLNKCGEGTGCVKLVGSHALSVYNRWATLMGKPIYDFEAEVKKMQISIIMTEDEFWREYDAGRRNFSYMNLKGAKFYNRIGDSGVPANRIGDSGVPNRRNMENIDFSNSILMNAIFHGLELINPLFTGANLTKAVFRRVILTNANLKRTILNDSLFEETSMRNADLSGEDVETNLGTGFVKTTALDSTFRDVKLNNAKINGADFTNTNFSGSVLRGAKMIDTKFLMCNFSNVDLSHAVIKNSNFRLANTDNACVNDVDIDEAKDINLDNVKFDCGRENLEINEAGFYASIDADMGVDSESESNFENWEGRENGGNGEGENGNNEDDNWEGGEEGGEDIGGDYD